jgi:hypothetical protein
LNRALDFAWSHGTTSGDPERPAYLNKRHACRGSDATDDYGNADDVALTLNDARQTWRHQLSSENS